ncbi:hypothetical protein IGL98_000487 [Enterococcus sp. DIV0840]|uniref:lysozyme family protein n=1 Tax=unclassified Enterococcus TaxID=2608891 RepID=UPI001A8EC3DA|nr:lysozyme family protein [Enterococcus sp. DIV0849a]MBO0433530.1 lysozyme family protein [Enterococcus sp. DIV0849a]
MSKPYKFSKRSSVELDGNKMRRYLMASKDNRNLNRMSNDNLFKGAENRFKINAKSHYTLAKNNKIIRTTQKKSKILTTKQKQNSKEAQAQKLLLLKRTKKGSSAYNGNPVGKMGGVKKNESAEKKNLFFLKGLKKSISVSKDSGKKSIVKIKGSKKTPTKTNKKKAFMRSNFQKMLIDKIGRNKDGDLNIIGMILTLVLLVPVIATMLVVTVITAVVITILSVILAILAFIATLFTFKTEDTELAQSYYYIAQFDAQKNKDIHDRYKSLVEDKKNDKVYFYVNNIKADPDKFMYSSDIETYLYYINAKYESYYLSWKVHDHVKDIHDQVFDYQVIKEKDKKVKETIIVTDSETGETTEKVVEKKINTATIKVKTKTINQFIDENPKLMTEEEKDRFIPIQELERFESKIFLSNPLGEDKVSSVIGKYGYRDRDPDNFHYYIVLEASSGTPVYAAGDGQVDSVSKNEIKTFDSKGEMKVYYDNLSKIYVKEGEYFNRGDRIGTTKGNLEIAMYDRRTSFVGRKTLYPAAYIDGLTFKYKSSLGHKSPSGGVQGNLINPGYFITRWRPLVEKATEKYGISGYENLILSVIWTETGGIAELYPDIMQSSESLGLPPNGIATPEKSIDAGVSYLAKLIKRTQEKQLNIRAAIQSYNYGEGYIDWLLEHELDYDFETAKYFSREKSNGKVVNYANEIATSMGYTWRYSYGNMFYVPKVTSYMMKDDERLIKIAEGEIGNKGGEKYWRWFGFDSQVSWCAVFVSWVSDQAGYLDEGRLPKSASTLEMVQWFKGIKKYQPATSSYTPKIGDLIFFDWDGGKTGKDHVGIVEYFDGNTIQTIEGNSENEVKRNTYAVDSVVISGYGITRMDENE